MISISGGNISANVDELTLPTNDMTAPKFGTIAANKTKIVLIEDKQSKFSIK